MCMFMGFAGYGIGGKSRYDHDMITEHIYVFDMIMNIYICILMLCVGLITFCTFSTFCTFTTFILYSLYTYGYLVTFVTFLLF